MTMKKEDRKNEYLKIMQLMLKGEDKKAFDCLAGMCGSDTGMYWLVDYDEAKAEIAAKSAEVKQ